MDLKCHVGQSVAVLCDPLNVTIHSIQDGKKTLSLAVGNKYLSQTRNPADPSGIWWLKNERSIVQEAIPDIFKRNGLIVRKGLECQLRPSHQNSDRFFTLNP
jgi:anaphase-promoting complex subunit 4